MRNLVLGQLKLAYSMKASILFFPISSKTNLATFCSNLTIRLSQAINHQIIL